MENEIIIEQLNDDTEQQRLNAQLMLKAVADELIKPVHLPAHENPVNVYLASLSAGLSRDITAHNLDRVAQILMGIKDRYEVNWGKMRFQHVMLLRSCLAQEFSPRTVNNKLAAVKGVLKAAWQLNIITAQDYMAIATVKKVKGHREPAGRDLSADEINSLFQVCYQDATAVGVRDAAMIAVLRHGLRRAEVVGLKLGDYDRTNQQFRVVGKGNKERLVPLLNGANEVVEDWLTIRGNEAGPLFCQAIGNTVKTSHKLHAGYVRKVLIKRGEQAGVTNFSPHDFRRTLIGDLLDAGVDIVTVQKIAGHSNVSTTALYDRRGERAKREAAQKIQIPHRR